MKKKIIRIAAAVCLVILTVCLLAVPAFALPVDIPDGWYKWNDFYVEGTKDISGTGSFPLWENNFESASATKDDPLRFVITDITATEGTDSTKDCQLSIEMLHENNVHYYISLYKHQSSGNQTIAYGKWERDENGNGITTDTYREYNVSVSDLKSIRLQYYMDGNNVCCQFAIEYKEDKTLSDTIVVPYEFYQSAYIAARNVDFAAKRVTYLPNNLAFYLGTRDDMTAYNDGYANGKRDGFSDGYDVGKMNSYDIGYTDGKNDGYKEAYNSALSDYNDSYGDVYNKIDSNEGTVTQGFLAGMWSGVQNFMQTILNGVTFSGLSLLAIVSTLLAILLAAFIIKMIRG